jgi:hypothetical protein
MVGTRSGTRSHAKRRMIYNGKNGAARPIVYALWRVRRGTSVNRATKKPGPISRWVFVAASFAVAVLAADLCRRVAAQTEVRPSGSPPNPTIARPRPIFASFVIFCLESSLLPLCSRFGNDRGFGAVRTIHYD